MVNGTRNVGWFLYGVEGATVRDLRLFVMGSNRATNDALSGSVIIEPLARLLVVINDRKGPA